MKFQQTFRRSNRLSQGGFTLIELIIAVAIVSILTAIALPSFQNYVLRSNRSAAEAHLMEIATRQGQFLIDNRAYSATLAALNVTTPASISSRYTITIAVAGGPPSYTLTATPSGKQTDDSCGTLTLDNTGAKTPTTGGCW